MVSPSPLFAQCAPQCSFSHKTQRHFRGSRRGARWRPTTATTRGRFSKTRRPLRLTVAAGRQTGALSRTRMQSRQRRRRRTSRAPCASTHTNGRVSTQRGIRVTCLLNILRWSVAQRTHAICGRSLSGLLALRRYIKFRILLAALFTSCDIGALRLCALSLGGVI